MRDREDSVPQYFEKRSPFWHFGSRGKKNPRWEFRGKFVGVRGKKWAPSQQEDVSQLKKLFDNIERLNRLPGYTSVLGKKKEKKKLRKNIINLQKQKKKNKKTSVFLFFHQIIPLFCSLGSFSEKTYYHTLL